MTQHAMTPVSQEGMAVGVVSGSVASGNCSITSRNQAQTQNTLVSGIALLYASVNRKTELGPSPADETAWTPPPARAKHHIVHHEFITTEQPYD